VVLTDDGHNYYVSITHLLEQLTSATESLLAPQAPNQVTVVTSSALASMYLLPRIPAFRQQHKNIQIRILARENLTGLGQSEYDLALYYSRDQLDAGVPVALFGEQIFPVCSPAYFKNNPDQFSNNSFVPRNLIWLEIAEDWVNWQEWLAEMQIEDHETSDRLVVNNYSMVIQAAIDGQGVALAWSQLCERELERGTLIRPNQLVLETHARFYLMLPPNRPIAGQTEIFRNWLIEQSRQHS
jgi:DNA-binding transcriptional LysR family regulator